MAGYLLIEEEPLATEVLERLHGSQNRHDLDAFVACFHPDYHSDQPVHPGRTFVGREQVRTNWAEIFSAVPDFQAELLRSVHAADTGWAEWHWHGTRIDGTRLDMRGVTIFGIRDDRLAWGRLYLEDVDLAGQGIDQAVRHMAQGAK
jgi:ketosteroid isomerase-like protein